MIGYLKFLYWRFIASPEKYARHIGVKIGKNSFISTRFWSSEPYLITIGDNVQITDGVRFFTHGGGMWLARNILILMHSARLRSKIVPMSAHVR